MAEKDFSQNEQEVELEEVKEGEDLESVKKALAEEKEKAEKYLANWQRAQADFVNYKRRTEQERAEVTNLANSALVLSLLPVLDDMERALGSIPEELANSTWVEGMTHIYRKLKSTLEAQGLSLIEAEGKEFDPHIHEAVMTGEGEEGKVVEEIQKGYKFRDRLLRPTMVKVGRGKASESQA